MSSKIYVLIDHGQGKIRTPSLESLALGQQMAEEQGCSLHPMILGKDIPGVVEKVRAAAAGSVLLVQDARLAEYTPHYYCAALRQILSEDQPQLLLMGHIYQNIDLAPKLAAALNTGLVTDCIGYRRDEQGLIFTRQMFRNRLNADVRIHSAQPWIVTMQAGAFSADQVQPGTAPLEERQVELSSVENLRRSVEAFEAIKGKVDLTKAEIIVAVGRGIKKSENLQLIEELAQLLGAEIAASRPVVDNEWLGRDRQIGSSGQTVSPRLYLACGISGAIQHIVGMKNSSCIVAINTDPNAPIFNIATYGIVGDLFEVVPALIKKLKADAAS